MQISSANQSSSKVFFRRLHMSILFWYEAAFQIYTWILESARELMKINNYSIRVSLRIKPRINTLLKRFQDNKQNSVYLNRFIWKVNSIQVVWVWNSSSWRSTGLNVTALMELCKYSKPWDLVDSLKRCCSAIAIAKFITTIRSV